MEIQNLMKSFIEIKSETDRLIKLLTEDWFNEDNFIKAFAEIEPYHLSNDILMGVVLYGLRLINDENFIKNYNLAEIDFLYKNLTEYDNKVSLELIMDYSSFLYSTMDENSTAKQLSEEGIKRAKDYIKEFKKIIKEIDEEGA